ncbi:MAG TPA: hypothetical protein VFB45_16275 [Pseudolabrys sp.]|nr:hypothetical protein [Pseudolabrys sp.]
MNRHQHPDPHLEKDKGDKQQKQKERSQVSAKDDEVVISSEDSFPASDPPSWTGVILGEAKKKVRSH